ncbi:MAG: hypothetical protein HY268_15945 [Deltaproteobacteria bacterium]|nr:hypothetical protein [Deltaproteobacteria bacterium]
MKRTSFGLTLLAIALVVWMKSPVTLSGEFVYGGGVLGIGTGAIIGAAAGNTMAGMAIGGPVGAIAGYFFEDSLKRALESDVAKRSRNESVVEVGGKNTEG